jgi:hypothetical protein
MVRKAFAAGRRAVNGLLHPGGVNRNVHCGGGAGEVRNPQPGTRGVITSLERSIGSRGTKLQRNRSVRSVTGTESGRACSVHELRSSSAFPLQSVGLVLCATREVRWRAVTRENVSNKRKPRVISTADRFSAY